MSSNISGLDLPRPECAPEAIQLIVGPDVGERADLLRYRWRLRQADEEEQVSPKSYATRREASREGEIVLERAIKRGSIRAMATDRRG